VVTPPRSCAEHEGQCSADDIQQIVIAGLKLVKLVDGDLVRKHVFRNTFMKTAVLHELVEAFYRQMTFIFEDTDIVRTFLACNLWWLDVKPVDFIRQVELRVPEGAIRSRAIPPPSIPPEPSEPRGLHVGARTRSS
jgi:hypothetical protein